MHERRRFTRLDQDFPVRHMISGEQWVERTEARNISTGGVHLVSDSGLEVGSRLKIELALPGFNDPFYAHGEVVWARPQASEQERKKYSLGVRFLRVVGRGDIKEF